MLKRVVPHAPTRVLEFPSGGRISFSNLTMGQEPQPLTEALASLRAEMNGLVIKLTREQGQASESALRAEQVAHAIQRLEWALER